MSDGGGPVDVLKELGKALGLLQESGELNPAWLKQPGQTSQDFDATRIEHLRKVLARLLGSAVAVSLDPPTLLEDADVAVPSGSWYGFHPSLPLFLVVGEDADAPRLLGLGGRLNTPHVQLSLQGWLAGLSAADFILPPTSPQLKPRILGRVGFQLSDGPLAGFSLAAALSEDGLADAALRVTDASGHTSSPLDLTPGAPQEALLDGLRLVFFALSALIRSKAQTGNLDAKRLVDHLFPLLGEASLTPPSNPIPPFPLEALTEGLDPLVAWLASFFPGPGALGNPQHDAVAATLFHLEALLRGSGTAPTVDGWEAWSESPNPSGRLGFFADGDAYGLTLGVRAEREGTVGGTRLHLGVRAPIVRGSSQGEGLTVGGDLQLSLTLAHPTSGTPLLATDLGTATGQLELTGLTLGTARLQLSRDRQWGMVATWALETLQAGGETGPVITPGDLAFEALVPLLLNELGTSSPAVATVLNSLFAAIPADTWLIHWGEASTAPSVAACRDLAALLLGLPAAPLQSINLGTQLSACLELGIKNGVSGLWLNPLSVPGAAVRLESGNLSATELGGPPTTLSLRLACAAFDGLPVRPVLELAEGAEAALSLSLVLLDGGGNPLLSWGILPTALPSREALLTGAASLLLWLVRARPELALPLTSGGLCLGKLLEYAGLGSWNGIELAPASLTTLQALTPLKVLGKGVSGLLNATPAGWLTTGPLEWKVLSQSGLLGLALRPKGGVPLIETDILDAGYDELQVFLVESTPGGFEFRPRLGIQALAVTAHGPEKAPLLEAAGLKVGGASVTVSLGVAESGLTLDAVALSLLQLQLPFGGGSGLTSQFLPSGAGPGFDLTVGWTPGGLEVDLNGNASCWFEIDRRFGPLDVERIGVAWTAQQTLEIQLEGGFSLAGVSIQPDGLGLVVPIDSLLTPDDWSFTLRGLGISFDQGGIQISGLFRNHNGDFQGAALVHAYSFQLGAIGAYKSLPSGPSLFVFAALAAPLGGPPWFFVTGVAGGFGYNRSFAVPDTVDGIVNLPFFGLMKGDLDLSHVAEIGAALDVYLQPARDTLWLAGGVTFTSFALVKGQALLYVVIGPQFELGLLALCGFEVPKIVNVELALKARFSTAGGDPNLLIMGGLTDRSWILGSACQLQGGFALQLWFGSGDVVLTLGGYSPEFKKPAKYPSVDRLGYRWSLSDAIVLKGDCYFALTPREAMGGSHFEVTGHWGPLSAGYYCWFDALVGWDPFYFFASLDVGVWGKVETPLGDVGIEVGVHVKLHGPPVGGNARIDLAILSIDIPFGSQSLPPSDPLSVGSFLSRSLGMSLPAALEAKHHLELPARQVCDATGKVLDQGLIGLEVRRGLLSEKGETPAGTKEKPYQLLPEFELVVRTRIPLASSGSFFSSYQNILNPLSSSLYQSIQFYPCRLEQLSSVLTAVYAGNPNGQPWVYALVESLPEALFGAGPTAGNEEVTRARVAGIRLDGTATSAQVLGGDHALGVRLSLPGEALPLPLGSKNRPLGTLSALLGMGQRLTEAALRARVGGEVYWSKHHAPPMLLHPLARIIDAGLVPPVCPWNPPPLPVKPLPLGKLRAIGYLKLQLGSLSAGMTRVSSSLESVPRVPAPQPCARPVGLARVSLMLVPEGRTPPASQRAVTEGIATQETVRLARMTQALLKEGATLDAGHASVWKLDHALPTGASLQVTGTQPVRALFLGALGSLIEEVRVGEGTQSLPIPEGTDRLVLLGLGRPPLREGGRDVLPVLPGAVGVAPGMTLLEVAERTSIGPGCLLQLRRGTPGRKKARAIPAAELLARAEALELHFQLPGPVWNLVLVVAPPAEDAVPLAQGLQWTSSLALQPPRVVVGSDRLAVVLETAGGRQTGSGRLKLRVSVQEGYRLKAVVLVPGPGLDEVNRLAGLSSWRFAATPPGTSGSSLVKLLETDPRTPDHRGGALESRPATAENVDVVQAPTEAAEVRSTSREDAR